MRDEQRKQGERIEALTTALTGNSLGTTGIHPRLAAAEAWISEARVRLAVIAAALGAGASGAIEAVKAFFASGGHEK